MFRPLVLIVCLAAIGCHAFTAPYQSWLTTRCMSWTTTTTITSSTGPFSSSVSTLKLFSKDPSRSGTKRDRLNRLAELEDERIETDKSFVVQAAGGFVVFIVILIAAAAGSGLLTQY